MLGDPISPLLPRFLLLIQAFDELLPLQFLLLFELFLAFLHLFEALLNAALPSGEHLPRPLLRIDEPRDFLLLLVDVVLGDLLGAA